MGMSASYVLSFAHMNQGKPGKQVVSGLEKTEVATLRWSVGRQSGTRWMTHTEKDVLIAALTQERDALLAQVSARPS
jgi:hypothetical protein